MRDQPRKGYVVDACIYCQGTGRTCVLCGRAMAACRCIEACPLNCPRCVAEFAIATELAAAIWVRIKDRLRRRILSRAD